MGERSRYLVLVALAAGLAACLGFAEPTSFVCEAETADVDCPRGWGCVTGVCVEGGGGAGGGATECVRIDDCAGKSAYCASDGTCHGLNCGQRGNDCDRCTAGPGGGSRHPFGPLVFDVRQVDKDVGSLALCTRTEAVDYCGSESFVRCEFSFLAYDEQFDQPPADELTSYLYEVGPAGETLAVVSPSFDGQRYTFQLCIPDDEDDFVKVIVLHDIMDQPSNSQCFRGSLQEAVP